MAAWLIDFIYFSLGRFFIIRSARALNLFLAAAVLISLPISKAESAVTDCLSFEEFKSLSEELSRKVNFFQDLWAQNPKAEIVGGTSRDFLYWVKFRFKDIKTRVDAENEILKLRSLSIIDIRQFVIGDSDIDLVSADNVSIQAEDYGVRKIDLISRDRLDPKSEMGMNERVQGYIPIEKMRLSASGFIPWEGFGDGIREIYDGKPSIHFTTDEEFKKGFFAKQFLNHPILLVLRYLRTLAINEFYSGSSRGEDLGGIKVLDREILQKIKKVITKAIESDDLKPYLAKPKFKDWLNSSIRRAFRAHNNPTIALELFKYFGVDHLAEKYPEDIEPLYQYVFRKNYDEKIVLESWKTQKIDFEAVLISGEKEFGDSLFFHGTPSEENYRSILRQGVLPSSEGTMGMGLYGVQESNREVALSYAENDASRIISFQIERDARILDLTTEAGSRLHHANQNNFDALCDSLGVEMVKLRYGDGIAYVVKNSRVLKQAVGINRPILPLDQILVEAQKINDKKDLLSFYDRISLNGLSTFEWELLFKVLKPFSEEPVLKEWLQLTEGMPRKNRFRLLEILLILWSDSADAGRFNKTILDYIEESQVTLGKIGGIAAKVYGILMGALLRTQKSFSTDLHSRRKAFLQQVPFFELLLHTTSLTRSDIYSKKVSRKSLQYLMHFLLFDSDLKKIERLELLFLADRSLQNSLSKNIILDLKEWISAKMNSLSGFIFLITIGMGLIYIQVEMIQTDQLLIKTIVRCIIAALFSGGAGYLWGINQGRKSVPNSWYFLPTIQQLWIRKFQKALETKRKELEIKTNALESSRACRKDIQTLKP